MMATLDCELKTDWKYEKAGPAFQVAKTGSEKGVAISRLKTWIKKKGGLDYIRK